MEDLDRIVWWQETKMKTILSKEHLVFVINNLKLDDPVLPTG